MLKESDTNTCKRRSRWKESTWSQVTTSKQQREKNNLSKIGVLRAVATVSSRFHNIQKTTSHAHGLLTLMVTKRRIVHCTKEVRPFRCTSIALDWTRSRSRSTRGVLTWLRWSHVSSCLVNPRMLHVCVDPLRVDWKDLILCDCFTSNFFIHSEVAQIFHFLFSSSTNFVSRQFFRLWRHPCMIVQRVIFRSLPIFQFWTLVILSGPLLIGYHVFW